MNYFLEPKQHSELIEMSKLRSQSYINSKGVRVNGKMLLLGVNTVKLVNVTLRSTVNNKYYITITLTRKPCSIIGLKSKVTFAPMQEFIFDYGRAKELCSAFGHELKDKPDDMDFNDYQTHVVRRIRTFDGKEMKVSVAYVKELRRDNFGIVEQRAIGVQRVDTNVTDYRQELTFHSIDSRVGADWYVIKHKFYL